MAVYEQSYRRYTGAVTPAWQRPFILPRYILKDIFKSKIFVALFSLSFVWPIFCTASIYIVNNADLLLALNADLSDFLAIDASFFNLFLRVQGFFVLVLSLFIGPGLISRDLANNGLPLYLYRPFSRSEYVLGKFLVLGLLLSAVTWIPGFYLFLLQGNLAKGGWIGNHLGILVGLFLGSWIGIAVISLLALAFSAWVKWRPVAAFLMLFVIFSGQFLSFLIEVLFKTEWGSILSLFKTIPTVWNSLFGLPISGPPVFASWLSLAFFAGFCLLLLQRKIRAYEVVS